MAKMEGGLFLMEGGYVFDKEGAVNNKSALCPGNNGPFNNAKKKWIFPFVECVSNLLFSHLAS